MPENIDQKAFCELIILVAVAICFKPNEEFLTEGQIISRGFTPIEAYSRSCISRMIDAGSLQFKMVEALFPEGYSDRTLYIKRPGNMSEDIDDFIYRKSQEIRGLLAQSLDYQLHLKAFTNELISCECIEYCEFYAKRADLKITNPTHNNAKLRLLILECSIDRLHMLFWRAIKTSSKKIMGSNKIVEFSAIVDSVYDLFINYRRLNVEIEGYAKPSSLKTSVLSGMVELFRGDN
jgi:hypothetical protein